MVTGMNKKALGVLEKILGSAADLGCAVETQSNGTTIVDCGVNVPGSTEAGRLVGEICLGGLGTVKMTEMTIGDVTMPAVDVETSEVLTATLCSQYAGWTINKDKYFAMASGPARAMAVVEKLYEEFDYKDDSDCAVIVLETREFPPENISEYIARKCGVETKDLYVVVAPTACEVGSVQISARVVEVGAHKLHELKFDVGKITHGRGNAPVAPIAKNDMRAMGVTNDCILYAGQTFYDIAPGAEDDFNAIVPKVPSSSSSQYGTPFYDLFKSFEFDFYKVDPLLFSPAEVTVKSEGKEFHAGAIDAPVLLGSIEAATKKKKK
jgi:methenyltetrahydromethanopterin cyclohydrolase